MKLNTKKCKTLRSEQTRNQDEIKINGEHVEDVTEFVYLGAVVGKEGGGSSEIKSRLQKARIAFHRLWKIWSSRGIDRKTKIHLFKSCAGIWLRDL